MTPRPAPRSTSRMAGLLIGGAVFAAVFGGYLAFGPDRPGDDTRLPLPGGTPAAGSCTLWFVGSSTIARWSTLARDFVPWDARARGANGALIPAITTRFRHDAPGPAPAAIVFYAGENDIAAGADAARALADFDRFMASKTQRFAALPVIAVSLKPSPARAAQLPQQTAFNAGLADRARRRDDLDLVDIRPLMRIGGQLGPFYADDGLHMNAAGYARWTAAIRPALAHAAPRAAACGIGRRG